MSRSRRINFKNAWHHVMNRGANHKNIFLSDSDRKFFLSLLNEIYQQYSIEIHAYCLMNNHYHLLINTPFGRLSEAIRYLNSVYASYFNRIYKCDGPLFRGRFKSTVISFDKHLLQVSKYIHLNPVKAKIVLNAEFYTWSSYRAYINHCKIPKWLINNTLLNFFSNKNKHSLYKKFVETDDKQKIDDYYNEDKWITVLGNNNFEKVIQKFLNSNQFNNRNTYPSLNILSIEEIKNTVAEYFEVNKSLIDKPTMLNENLPRSIAIWLSRNFGNYSHKSIAAAFSCTSSSSISVVLWRLKQKFFDNINIVNDIFQIEKVLREKTDCL